MAKAAKKSAKSKRSGSRKRPNGSSARSAGTDAGKRLVVVESPAKAKTINKYLGKDYVVRASMGHVRDLPKRNAKGEDNPVPGVDIEHDFEPTYQPLPGRQKVLTELRKIAKSSPEVFLATDLDREGEAIAWHLAEALNLDADRRRRVVFNEITPSAIREAFEHPHDLDMDKVKAQQARRILDRIVGYQVSPLLWKKVAGGLSAGRVQSVAVRLIVEREREIDAFVPEEYWKISAIFCPEPADADRIRDDWLAYLARRNEKGEGPTRKAQQNWLAENGAFLAELAKINTKRFLAPDEDSALEVARGMGMDIESLERTEHPKAKGPAKNRVTVHGKLSANAPPFVVQKLKQRDSRSRPHPPFTTASLQQSASVQLYFTAQRTMRVAQQLYEGLDVSGEGVVGLITYMRTDSRNLSRDAVTSVRGMIEKQFGGEYLPEKPNFYTSGERAQEAHEAIRPTDPTRTPESLKKSLSEEQWKLYDLIWRRFVSCQMAPAVWAVTEADIVVEIPSGDATFRAMGRTLKFDGFLRVAGVPKSGEQILPELQEHQRLGVVQVDPTQHFTQPPPRYTEASLVKALEADNIGRPSTYAAIIQTIQDRKYVEMMNRSFRPTDLGCVVIDKLVKHFPKIFEVHFTAHMEDELDRVEQAEADWTRVLREFYDPFKDQLERAHEDMVHAKAETEPSEYECPDCGAPMEYRFGKNGRFLSCTRYPECKKALPIDREGKPMGVQATDIACPKCGQPTTLRRGRFGPFLSCMNYPDCKGVVNLDRKGGIKTPSPPPLPVDLQCPKCDSEVMNLRRGKRGPWLSCARYPKCRGRLPWKTMDEEKRDALEAQLEEHEKAHPIEPIRMTDGEIAPDGYVPQVQGADVEDDTPTEDDDS